MYVLGGFFKYDPLCYTSYRTPSVYDTLEDAVYEAKIRARRDKGDVDIWRKSHVVKFPEIPLEVVEIKNES